MPQRAIIYEESGHKDVHAYDLPDDHWYGVIEAAEAGRLKLPCCGVLAKPRDPENMIRHFAHPPNSLDNCQAKKTGNGHETIIAAVAAMAKGLGWQVTPEVRFEAGFCDVVCEREKSGLKIGFEFETGTRNSSNIEGVDAALKGGGIHQLHWFLKKGRHGGTPNVKNVHRFTMANTKEAAVSITSKCRQVLKDLEQTILNANSVTQALKENRIPFERHFVDNIPDSVSAFPEGEDRPHTIIFGPNEVHVEHPNTRVHRTNFGLGEKTARAQESLIRIIRKKLKSGKTLWWKGHPNLLTDSFRELRDSIEQEERRKIEARESLRRKSARVDLQVDDTDICQPKRPRSELAELAAGTQAITTQQGMYVSMRLKEVKAFLKRHFGEDFTEALMEQPMAELGGQSPKALAASTSQSLERIQIALGYRDPGSKEPIKRIHGLTLD